jgi:tetratricopeptide (TPR) repeat protein
MKKLSLLMIVVSFLFTGCGFQKMAKKYEDVTYQVIPEVLETHGGVVKVEVKGKFPEKYFHKRASVDFQPYFEYEGGKQQLKSVKIAGEKVQGATVTIKRKAGGSFTYTDQFNYQPYMNVGELQVNVKAVKGKKSLELGQTKLADGIIATSERLGWDEDLEVAAHGYEKETIITKKASLYFDYNDARLSTSQKLNKMKENIDKINELKTFIEKEWVIKNIEVNAWASPEGELSINTKLSEDRGKAAEKWLLDYFNTADRNKARTTKMKIEDVKRKYTHTVNAKGEDFDGFMAAIQNSNLAEKQAIINVIKMQTTKTQREQEIKNMTVIYAEIETILEPLRRAEIVVHCFEPKKTDEQIAEFAITNPTQLDEKELMYAATLTDNIDTKLKIYNTATTQFSSNWKGFNNAGVILMEKKNLNEATVMFEKANALAPNNGQILNNLGVATMWKKDFKAAGEYYEKAKQAGVSHNYNMGVLKIKGGEYDEAMRLMSGKSCRYNLALLQLLQGNAAEAVKTIDCIKEKGANAYYLKAIAGARTGNTSVLIDNLKKAVSENPNYKAEAKKDREFIKYFNNPDFQNAVK